MSYIIVGLGNPGEEYENTRHNTGRIALASFIKEYDLVLEPNKQTKSLMAKGKVGKESVVVLLPETFMNKSGEAVKPLVTSAKKAETLVVVHDDLDLPIGTIKMVFNRGSGGHKGVESIMRAAKTEGFLRIKVGVSPTTPGGKLKKPTGEKVIDFIIGKFKTPELDIMKKKVGKKITEVLETLCADGRERATAVANTN
ncbi:MAG: aminoacyl-tRNA hydrolase [Candidatus Paceibacterota bacterium]|jgi:PTH1 family peptidyl-tRNA hydrolase